MSTITKKWTEEKIRMIIRKLDEKSGLHAADLPINFSCRGRVLGCYHYVEPKAFGFNRKFFDDPDTKEAEVIDVIRHEVAHHLVDMANLEKYIGHTKRETSHGDDWKWAAKKLGADPTRCHNLAFFHDKDWSTAEAMAAYNANDVAKFDDVLSFIRKWDQLPLDNNMSTKMQEYIKENNPDFFYEIGEEVLHPQRGFGIVNSTIPRNNWSQKIYVCFEDGTDGVFVTKELCKVTKGSVIPYRSCRRC